MTLATDTTSSPTLTLQPAAFHTLPLGAIHPAGWLADQLRVQADGLSGHLDEFWPSVRDSAWVGGSGDAWERGPYWLDGMVPLAVLLEDDRLLAKVRRWIDHILTTQGEDGRLGPETIIERGHAKYDTWPLFVVFKALTQWHSATGDERIVPAINHALQFLEKYIRQHPIYGWGKHRTADLVLTVQWLFEQTGEPWLIDLQRLVESQGYDWAALYAGDYPHREKTSNLVIGAGHISATHGPNAAMGLKHPAVRWRVSGEESDRTAIFDMIATLDRYHGQASGVFTCDEHLAGRSPAQGTELCAVVEYLFSLETVIPLLGREAAALGDRFEQIAFNALPAAFSPDMWAHQYDQQANQIAAKRFAHPIWTDNNGEANTFGLEPHFGCCTANMHQGWPKFAAHLWMQQAEDGALVALSYAPCSLRTTVRGVGVNVDVKTEYPFNDTIKITLRANQPMTVPLLLRIPEWAEGATVENGVHHSPAAGAFYGFQIEATPEPHTITLRLPMPVRVEERDRRAAVVHRGPVVYSLKIDEDWKPFRGEAPHQDFEVLPKSPWNVAIELDRDEPHRSFEITEQRAGRGTFSRTETPVTLRGTGRVLTNWQVDPTHEVATAPPISPIDPAAAGAGDCMPIELIPFGSAKLRMTELPWIASSLKGSR